jgi:hypothetical protein
MHLLTSTKKYLSIKELQCQLGHNRYHPIWHMTHKLREAMGKRDGESVLAGRIELDEGYFSTKVSQNEQDKSLKRGRGSQKKTKVLVMAESEFVESESHKKGQNRRYAGESLFNRLLVACVRYKNEFRYVYG